MRATGIVAGMDISCYWGVQDAHGAYALSAVLRLIRGRNYQMVVGMERAEEMERL